MKIERINRIALTASLVIGIIICAIVFFACGGVGSEKVSAETTAPSATTAETTVAETTEETTAEKTFYIREFCEGNLYEMTEHTETEGKKAIDAIISDWNASNYNHMGTGESEVDGKYTVDLYFEKREIEIIDDWCYIDCPNQINSLYEGVHCITDTTSYQWAWLQSHDYYFDSEGIATYDGRTLVALSPAFGGIGDYVDLLLADGSVLPVIIVDHKGNSETWGHNHDGAINVIEILVSYEWYEGNYENKWYADVVAFR